MTFLQTTRATISYRALAGLAPGKLAPSVSRTAAGRGLPGNH